jgi:hypothetical protein
LAQGIGAHLEVLGRQGGVVEVKGDKARLLPVSERRAVLFGVEGRQTPADEGGRRKRKQGGKQMAFGEIEAVVGPLTPAPDAPEGFTAGKTTLDRIHQAMLLFGDGRSEALRRFLVEEGIGRDQGFWGLAQTLSALLSTTDQIVPKTTAQNVPFSTREMSAGREAAPWADRFCRTAFFAGALAATAGAVKGGAALSRRPAGMRNEVEHP